MVTPAAKARVVQVYQWTIIGLGMLALALAQPSWGSEPEVLATLVIIFGIAEYIPVRVRVGVVSFSFPIGYAAFLLYGPAGSAWVAAVGTLCAKLARRRSWRVSLFNGAQFALAAMIAARTSLLYPGSPTLQRYMLPLLCFLVVYYTANNAIVDLLLWLRLKPYRLADWAFKNRFEALSAAISFAYTALMMFLAPQQRGHDPIALTFFFIPLLTIGAFARLITNLSLFAKHLETLMEVSALAAFAPEPTTAVSVPAEETHALNAVLAHLDAFDEYRFAAVYRSEGDELVAAATRGIGIDGLTHQRIPIGQGLTGWAARERTPIFAPEASQDPRNNIGEGTKEDALMIAALPLLSSGQLLGVLTIGKERSHSIQPEDIHLLTIFANLVGAVMLSRQAARERERVILLQERNRLAREIHDGIAQSLAGSILQMEHLDRILTSHPQGRASCCGQSGSTCA